MFKYFTNKYQYYSFFGAEKEKWASMLIETPRMTYHGMGKGY